MAGGVRGSDLVGHLPWSGRPWPRCDHSQTRGLAALALLIGAPHRLGVVIRIDPSHGGELLHEARATLLGVAVLEVVQAAALAIDNGSVKVDEAALEHFLCVPKMGTL